MEPEQPVTRTLDHGPEDERLREAEQALAERDRRLLEAERTLAAQSARLIVYEQMLQAKDGQISRQEQALQALRAQVQQWEIRWANFELTPGGTLLRRLQRLRAAVAPPTSSRDHVLDALWQMARRHDRRSFRESWARIRMEVGQQTRMLGWRAEQRLEWPALETRILPVAPIQPRPPVTAHLEPVDIVICVHNALEDLQRCLAAVLAHTTYPFHLILVDDGSDAVTADFVASFARLHGAELVRHERAMGYTRAANAALRRSTDDFVVLLNSDTLVTPGWLDRLVACARADARVGLVGPLSNTASWQSIPELEREGDWAPNPLPEGMTAAEMGELVAGYSGRLYPPMAFLNGFCLLLNRQTIAEIGLFDEENFALGYGEENDYALRARKAGWKATLADDAYVYHAQSRSYTTDRRKKLADEAHQSLERKHGGAAVQEGVASCRDSRTLAGIRARSRAMLEREEWLRRGRQRFAGSRVLIALPIDTPGGGGNVVLFEARSMRKMGVDVSIFNLARNRANFEAAYPDLELPVVYGASDELCDRAAGFDAVVATANQSVPWMTRCAPRDGRLVLGYYVQEFEPWMYPPDSDAHRAAMASYTLAPEMRCFTKTDWTRQEVLAQTGALCALVGPSVDIDLFRPRPRPDEAAGAPLRIAAMVRPSSAYRQPALTMEILRRAKRTFGDAVDIRIFGAQLDDPGLRELPLDFAWQSAGVLPTRQVASFLNEADIFLDLSSHQAMGLTALEAMACGVAVVVPQTGGATSFASHEWNSLVVDTTSPEACWEALQRLVDDAALRTRLRRQALDDVCAFYPEKPAYAILDVLLSGNPA